MTMLAWSEWRNAAVAVVWITVLGGLLMATIWASRGGFTATGPEDDLMGEERARHKASPRRHRRATSFGAAQIISHGLLGLMTAGLVTYAAALRDDRTGGYVFIIVAILVTAIPGSRMFWKWRQGLRPATAEGDTRIEEQRSEDHLPRPVVYLHGLAAFSTLAILVLLVVKDT